MVGCGNTKVCLEYPKPSKDILIKLKNLNDRNIDLWMIEQYKLNKKLEVMCNA
jgi:hypothetical protein